MRRSIPTPIVWGRKRDMNNHAGDPIEPVTVQKAGSGCESWESLGRARGSA
jgi:hypothetical protein